MKMARFLVDAIFQRDYSVVQDVHILIALCILLGNLLVDVTYVSLNPRIRYQSVVGLTARGAIAREGFYERTASPQDPRYESSRAAQSRPGRWRDAVRLAPCMTPRALGGRSGAAQARRHPARARV